MPKTTLISSRLGVIREALFDELQKIASEVEPSRGARLKKVLKNTALLLGGTAAGSVATTAADHLIGKHLGSRWAGLPQNTKKYLIGPALGLALVGSHMAAKRLQAAKDE